MKVVHINTFPYKATGRIMLDIHHALQAEGYESYAVWGRGRDASNEWERTIKDDIGVKLHGVMTRLTDRTGFFSQSATKSLLKELDIIRPDIVHLHNIHGYYVNIEMLFQYLKDREIKVVWTLHDCWPFTGHCAYFDRAGCDRWKTGCHNCPEKKSYPGSVVMDASKWNWMKKRELFTSANITFVTPCQWLKEILSQSFFSGYPAVVINNGIDTSAFKPTESNFRKVNGLEDKTIILGVASEWTERKGLKDFVQLSEMLDRNRYQIVLVGLTPKQIDKLPKHIIGIQRTENIEALAGLYTIADCLFNPTYEDNYPTTNLEAQACGTHVITYRTGGSPETIKGNGIVFEKGNLKGVVEYLANVDSFKKMKVDDSLIERQAMIEGYRKLYKKISEG